MTIDELYSKLNFNFIKSDFEIMVLKGVLLDIVNVYNDDQINSSIYLIRKVVIDKFHEDYTKLLPIYLST